MTERRIFNKYAKKGEISREYIFSCSKMIDNDEAEPLLVLFACLTKRFKQNLGETTREKVIAIESVMLETPVSKMPPYADDIPEGSIFVQLSKEEFERLVNIAKEDPKTSYLYTYRLDETIT